jgi:hypothetical protein
MDDPEFKKQQEQKNFLLSIQPPIQWVPDFVPAIKAAGARSSQACVSQIPAAEVNYKVHNKCHDIIIIISSLAHQTRLPQNSRNFV